METVYDWYKIANLAAFLATGLISEEFLLDLEDLGEKNFILFSGNEVSVRVDDIYLPLQFNAQNPFQFEDNATYVDPNGDIWVGFAHAS